ncbi:MAG: M56 family metallopeptidase [Defluviitaleaceae bacterium]|nr:M56 family metallopeptidase [Defluviitaleaceae bacterium]
MSISAAVLILTIVIIRSFTIHKLPKITFVILWAVVLFCLLILFSIPLFNAALQIAGSVFTITTVWVIGVLAFAFFFGGTHFRYRREYCASLPVDCDTAHKWLKEQELMRSLQIRQSDRIKLPLTYGILKPVILLPKTTDWQNEISLHYVLTHELVHIKHFDIIIKWLLVLALCIHWFNPLVWVMYVFANRDIELSCDEAVVKVFEGRLNPAYALAIMRLEEKEAAPMFNIQSFDRCTFEYCRKFLKEDEKTIGICRDCAEIRVLGYSKMFRFRSIIGGVIIGFVFLFAPFLNQVLGLSIWPFDSIVSIGFIGVIPLIILCYLLPFARKVKLETIMGYFQQKLDSRGEDIGSLALGIQPDSARGRFGASPDVYGRVGITVIELFASFISGPFFFVYGIYKYRQLTAYIKGYRS